MSSQNSETKAPPSTSNIEYVVLPKKCVNDMKWGKMIEKYKDFRLFALGESPEAFASTLAVETTFSMDIWAGRLANPRALHLFAIHLSSSADLTTDYGKIEALLSNEWIAQTVFVSIDDSEVAKLAADKSPWAHSSQDVVESPVSCLADAKCVVFALNGVYVASGFRQRGIGTSMVAASIDNVIRMAKSRELSRVQFQVRVDEDNAPAIKLYESVGFERGETERLVMGEKEKDGVKMPPRAAEILVMHRHVSLK